MESTINLNLGNEILEGTEVSTNVKQQIIVAPKDRAKLILKEYEEQQRGKVDWLSPIALVITILANLLTADFKDKVFGLDKVFGKDSLYGSLFLAFAGVFIESI